jgi:hypothetical protein
MSHYTEFKLYWEQWGGYPDRTYPFGNPNLVWVIATKDSAARCLVRQESRGAMDVQGKADWERIPYTLVEQLIPLLHEAGVFSAAPHIGMDALVQPAANGDYLCVEDLTGVLDNRPFHLSLKYSAPGGEWSPLGERLRTVLIALRDYQAGIPAH